MGKGGLAFSKSDWRDAEQFWLDVCSRISISWMGCDWIGIRIRLGSAVVVVMRDDVVPAVS
jgi:hypothetical protein